MQSTHCCCLTQHRAKYLFRHSHSPTSWTRSGPTCAQSSTNRDCIPSLVWTSASLIVLAMSKYTMRTYSRAEVNGSKRLCTIAMPSELICTLTQCNSHNLDAAKKKGDRHGVGEDHRLLESLALQTRGVSSRACPSLQTLLLKKHQDRRETSHQTPTLSSLPTPSNLTRSSERVSARSTAKVTFTFVPAP